MTTIADQLAALVKALEDIAAIEDQLVGSDWEEIEQARKIATDALAAYNSAQKAEGEVVVTDELRKEMAAEFVEAVFASFERGRQQGIESAKEIIGDMQSLGFAASSAQEPGWVMVPVEPDRAMATGACESHYGARRTRTAGGIDGVDMTVNNNGFNFWEAWRRMWKGALAAAPARLAGATQGEAISPNYPHQFNGVIGAVRGVVWVDDWIDGAARLVERGSEDAFCKSNKVAYRLYIKCGEGGRAAPKSTDCRDEMQRISEIANAALNQSPADQRNILEDISDRLLALMGRMQ